MDEERAALLAGIQRLVAAIAQYRVAQQRPLAPLPPPERCSVASFLDTLLHRLPLLCLLAFLVIMWRRLGDYRATLSNRDTAFVVVALFVAGVLFDWWARGTRRAA